MIEARFFWFNIFILALGTFTIRSFFIYMSARIKLSERIKEILTYIPAAILPAMLTPMVFFHQGEVLYFFGKERLVIVILATVVCYYSKSMIFTIFFGLTLLYLLTQI